MSCDAKKSPAFTAAIPLSRAIVIASCSLFAMGCSSLMVGSISSLTRHVPDFESSTKFSLSEDPNSRTVVVCNIPDQVRSNYPEIDNDLAVQVTETLARYGVTVAEQELVQGWAESHDDWLQRNNIGRELGAAYVVNLDLHDYREGIPALDSSAPGVIYDPDRHSTGLKEKTTPAGPRTEVAVTVSVIHVSPLEGNVPVYRKTLTMSVEEPSGNSKDAAFDALILKSLSLEISRLFCDAPSGQSSLGQYDFAVRMSESELPR